MITYDKGEKENLCALLYPTDAFRNYAINDFNQEISEYVLDDIIISEENLDTVVRKENLKTTRVIFRNFLKNNPTHLNLIRDYYADLELDDILELMIINYVFYRSQMMDKFKQASIFFNPHFITYETLKVNKKIVY